MAKQNSTSTSTYTLPTKSSSRPGRRRKSSGGCGTCCRHVWRPCLVVDLVRQWMEKCSGPTVSSSCEARAGAWRLIIRV